MRILVVGAGAIGGYFGGRLLQAGRDVTFLVRPPRAALLAERGLSIKSRIGDFQLPAPPTVTEDGLQDPFDLVLLSCKAYDLDGAMASFAKAVGPRTAILPLLNGMQHLHALADRFGPDHLLGGLCVISATLDADGGIVPSRRPPLPDFWRARRRAIAADRSDCVDTVRRRFRRAAQRRDPAGHVGEMDLHRRSRGHHLPDAPAIGDIVAVGASDLSAGLLDECVAIAASEGFPARRPFLDGVRATLQAPGSTITASMLRDIEGGKPVEAEAILGDLLRRASKADSHSLLRIAYAHVKAYEARRERDEPMVEKTAQASNSQA
jgi:2-dehydropantoate 2-reductase